MVDQTIADLSNIQLDAIWWRSQVRVLTREQRNMLLKHLHHQHGRRPYDVRRDSLSLLTGLSILKLIQFERNTSRPSYTEPTVLGRHMTAAILAQEADALTTMGRAEGHTFSTFGQRTKGQHVESRMGRPSQASERSPEARTLGQPGRRSDQGTGSGIRSIPSPQLEGQIDQRAVVTVGED